MLMSGKRLGALLLLAVAAQAKMKVHDPHRIFCGSALCYDVLEVAETATEEEIKKSYRKLAREWHPDKNPEKIAKKKFQKIAKAYETVGNEEGRKNYDFLMNNPQEYRKKYGDYYYFVSAPKSNVFVVLVLMLALSSGVHLVMLQQQVAEYNEKLAKVCVENGNMKAGGNAETMELHRKAKEMFEAAEKEAVKEAKAAKVARPQKVKSFKKDDKFRKIIDELIDQSEMKMAAPTISQTIGVRLPFIVADGISFQLTWFKRHTLAKEPYTAEEKEYMMKRAMGEYEWFQLTPREQDEFLALDEPWNSQLLEKRVQKASSKKKN